MLLRIKVKPNARMDEISREADGTLRVKIKAPPVEGKANKYLSEYIAGRLGIAPSRVTLLKGAGTSHKTLNIDAEEAYVLAKLGL
ncbi:MAG: DUF167 domain-containing protein [Bacteroidetes bacterium]|nr:DUF167 domain-containing protein [Bacteroidota bacterium]